MEVFMIYLSLMPSEGQVAQNSLKCPKQGGDLL